MAEILDFVRRAGEDGGGTMAALGILLRVTVLLLVATPAAFALRRASAALRHMVWTLSLAGTLLIPLGYWALPAWQWSILPQRQQLPAPSMAPVAEDALPEAALRSADSPYPFDAPAGESFGIPTIPPATVAERSTTPRSPLPAWSWPLFFAALWALGTFLGLVWLGIGVVGAWYVARRSQPAADPRWRRILQQLLAPCGLRRAIEVRQCPQVSVPMTWGLCRPVILVPAGSEGWSEETQRSVLLHELGHIRRFDCLMLLLGRLACVAYWFHPLVWLAARQLGKTGEQAADDAVLASNIAPPDYAEHLVGIAAQMRGLHLFGHVALPMASPSDLEGRVLAILDPQRNHRSLKRKTCYALLIAALLFLIPCALLRLGYAQDKKSHEPTSTTQNSPVNDAAATSAQAPGQTVKVDLKLDHHGTEPPARKPAAVTAPVTPETLLLSGMVVDQDGKPVAGVSIRALTPGDHEPIAQSDAAGRFELRVDRGRARGLTILARTADRTRQAYLHYGDLDLSSVALPPARLTIVPARSIEVQVVDGSGTPVADAVVGAVVNLLRGLETGHSDRHGKYTLRIPAKAPLQNIYAMKSRLGLDYLSFPKPERVTTGDLPPPPDLSRPLILQLKGARTVRIKLIDTEGRPIEGVPVGPWYFQKPEWGRLDDLNICGVKDFKKKSDAAGKTVFDWIPTWNQKSITFWASDGDRWARDRIAWDPWDHQKDSPEITARLQRTVPVRGRVRHADGSPAAGILIQAEGNGKSVDYFRGQAWSNEKGRYELHVFPDKVYLFAVSDEHWAAPARSGIAVRPDTPVEGIDFQPLRPATRLHGQLTLGRERKPWPGQTVTLIQEGPEQQTADRRYPTIPRWTTTDAEGRYVFAIGPGRYELWATDYDAPQKFTVTDEKELVYDFPAPRKPRGPLTVRVVDGSNPPRPVPHAHVVGVSVSGMNRARLEATTNDQGWFRVERRLDEMIVCAFIKEKNLVGCVTITGDDVEVTVPVQPFGAAKGRVIDQATGLPAVDREIRYDSRYGYEIPNLSSVGSSYLAGIARTDAMGRFKIADLVPGLEYQLSVPLFKDIDPSGEHRYDWLGRVTAKSGETVDLGDVKFRENMTSGELLGAVLANQTPLDKRLKAMADGGHKGGRRVLIMFWDQGDETSDRNMIAVSDVKRFARYYVISSPVDLKQIEAAKRAYAKKWGSDLFAESWPLFCILDVDGSTLAVKSTREFLKQGKVDDSLLIDFLKKYALKTPDVK